MIDLEHQIRAVLRSEADAMRIPAARPGVYVAPVIQMPAPRGRARIAMVAAAAFLVVAGVGVLAQRRAEPPPAASDVPAVPAFHLETATTSAEANAAMEQWPVTFRDLLDQALPDGFTALLGARNPLEAVAYNDQGIRLSVVVDLANSEGAAKGIPPDESSALTPEGDRVMGEVVYDYNDAMVPGADQIAAVEDARSLLPGVIAQIATGFTADTRAAILDAAYPDADSAALRDNIDAVLAPMLGAVAGNRILGGADFALMYSNDTTFVTVSAVRSARSLPDGITNPAVTATTGLRWVNGWQIIVASTPVADGQAPLDASSMQQILDTIDPLFAAWQPAPTPEPGCATHIVQIGDSEAIVAERYGVTLDDLERANPDLHANFLGGATVVIPCTPAVTIPASTPPPDSWLASGASKAAWSFEATNGIVRSSATLTYTVSGGFNTETNEGAILITVTTFDGQPVREDLILLSPCSQPTELVDNLGAPLEQIPFTCGPTGDIVTIDVYSGQSPLTVGMTGFSPPDSNSSSQTTTVPS
jgi:hypothetical protein